MEAAIDEALGKMQTLRMGNGQRRRTDVFGEQAPQVATRHAEALRPHFDLAFAFFATHI